jgi:tetratricopeptide (TPR) repeat protein
MLLRKKGYSQETMPEIRTDLERTIALMPDFAAAHAFLCIAYSQMQETKPKAAVEARRAMELEPGNLAYYIDLGKAFLANGQNEDAKKIADRALKVATLPRDRNMANAFLRQVQGKQNPSAQASTLAEASDPVTGESGSAPAAAQPAKEAVHANGQISELLCGHPPEVLFTLSGSNESTLLRVRDIGKIEIYDGGAASTAMTMPCTKWRDRKASVVYEHSADGPAQGEVKRIDLE